MLPSLANEAEFGEALREGVRLHRAGMLAQAGEAYERALADEPGNAEAWHLWGLASLHQGQPDLARQRLVRALELDPEVASFHHSLGLALAALRRSDEAIACLLRAVNLSPRWPEACLSLARAMLEDRRILPALEALRRVCRLRPDWQEPLAMLTDLLARLTRESHPVTRPQASQTGAPEGPANPPSSTSVIICSVDPAKFARVSANYRALFPPQGLEIIGIHDARSLCEGYNRGVRRSHGEVVIFSHDDVELLSPRFATRLRDHLERFDLVGVAGTSRLTGESWIKAGWPYMHGLVPHRSPDGGHYNVCVYGGPFPVIDDIQAMDGLFLAARREAALALPFDEVAFDGFHLYDLDFTFSASLAGFKLGVCPDLMIAHQSGGSYDAQWRVYADRFLAKYGARLAPSTGIAPHWPSARLPNLDQTVRFCRRLLDWLSHDGPALVDLTAPRKQSEVVAPPEHRAALEQAVALHQAGRLAEARAAYQAFILSHPRHPDALNLMGLVAFQEEAHQEALDLFRRALAVDQGVLEFHSNLGMTLRALGRYEEAAAAYAKGLTMDGAHAGLHYNLANLSQDMGRYAEAEAAYLRALEITPAFPEAHYNLGNAYKSWGRLEEAKQSYQRALEINPRHHGAHNNLANALLDQGRFDQALDRYRAALEIEPAPGQGGRRVDHAGTYSNILNCMNYDPARSEEEMFAEHQAWGGRFAPPGLVRPGSWPNSPDPLRRLRVGLVSGDFCRHPVGYFLAGFLARHDRRQMEVVCYSQRETEDELTRRFKEQAALWRPTFKLDDQALVQRIRDDGIDVLVDLAGHTALNRLPVFAHKPAPVQVSWLGYYNTTGIKAMDYIIMDQWTTPPGAERWFTEELVRLSRPRFCYTPPEYAPPVGSLPALAGRGVTFASFNNLTKLTDEVAALWAELLRQVPGARLLLKWKTLVSQGERQRLAEMFLARGLEPERLILRPASAHEQMLGEYNEVDIALDPFPFSGALTTCEALWMGVPVITRPGTRPVSRQTLGFLQGLGLAELAAKDAEDYLRIAVGLARDLPRLAGLRQGLRRRMAESVVCDEAGFAEEIQATLRQVWTRWCQQAGTRQNQVETGGRS